MLLKSLAATALAIKATQAFVIVPGISQADSDIVNTLPFEQPSSEMGLASHRVKVDCPGCPLAMRHHDGRYHTMSNINNHLELTFSIDTDTSGVDHLLVNDFELYPKPASWYKALRAPQIPDFTEAATKHPRKSNPNTPQLGYSLGVRPIAKDTDQQLELVEIDLQIIEVGTNFVSDIPNVNVKLIKTPTGNLMIANVEQTETSVPSHQDEEEHVEAPAEDCTTFYCKWRAAILNKMHRMKHCGGRKNHGAMRGQHRHGHHNGQVRHHHHTWAQLAKNVASHILLPVLIGIVAGVSVSIIGMMVGTFVVCLWRVFVRRQPPFARRHCRRRARKSIHREAAPVEEKSGLMAETEDLPPYKDDEEVSKTETAQV